MYMLSYVYCQPLAPQHVSTYHLIVWHRECFSDFLIHSGLQYRNTLKILGCFFKKKKLLGSFECCQKTILLQRDYIPDHGINNKITFWQLILLIVIKTYTYDDMFKQDAIKTNICLHTSFHMKAAK